jgi:chaperonin cofactor prefoldin
MFASPDVYARERHDMEERWETLHRRYRILGVGLLLLALALAGGGWYAYRALQSDQMALTQFPGVQKVVDVIHDQVKQTDQKLASWADDQQSLRDQIAKLSQKMELRIASVTKQAQVSSAEMYRRVQAQIDERLQRVDTRLTRIESSGETEQTRVAELQRGLAEMRSQAGRQADDLAAIRSQMEESGAANQQRFAGLQQSEEADRSDVDAIGHKLAVHCVDFEVTKNHSRELAEGVSLGVTSTDVAHRNVSGWMWLMPDRRTIWLKNQNASQPVVFYSREDGKKRELVINNVTKDSVTGYLLLPGESGAGREVAAATSGN